MAEWITLIVLHIGIGFYLSDMFSKNSNFTSPREEAGFIFCMTLAWPFMLFLGIALQFITNKR